MRNVPFLDLPRQHAPLKTELIQVFSEALDQAAFVGGAQVAAFEKEFADYVGTPHAIGVANGTCALRFALMALGVKLGDRVVTVPNTFIATTEAISQVSAHFDFVDVDPETSLMDMNRLEDYLKKNRPSVVVPVHLYGQCAEMDDLLALQKKFEFKILEDAAQAHGATHRGRPAGTLGDAAGFSFYPGKNLGACGEAGAVTTSSADVAARIRMIREHGQALKYHHDLEGDNGRLDAIQAGFLRVKLRHLDVWNRQRRAVAAVYDEAFSSVSSVRPAKVHGHNVSCYHLYVVHVPNRERLQAFLKENGVATAFHYPVPLHLQKCYADRGMGQGSFPVSEKLCSELLSLPMSGETSLEDARYVAEMVRCFEQSSV